ncbi:unnamed protein product [Bubo scandiacus]
MILGVMFSNGRLWKQQRCFGLARMRKMGVGKKDQEYRLQEEARHLVAYLQKTNRKSLDPTMPVVHTVSNVICSVIFGHRFSKDDENFHCLIESTDTMAAFMNITSFFTKGDADATYDEENLIQSIFDLFLAGTETTATTLCWALLYMVIYPDIQKKDKGCKKEVSKQKPKQVKKEGVIEIIWLIAVSVLSQGTVHVWGSCGQGWSSLLSSTLLQAFTFTLPEGVKEVNTKFGFGSTMKPPPYRLCAIPR